MPGCGITYRQVVDAAWECRTFPDAAARLGVGETTLRRCAAEHGLSPHFEDRSGTRCPTRLTKRRLSYWLRQGMTRKDIAEALGVSYCHLNVMIRRHGFQASLPNRGEASWAARRGAAGAESIGLKEEGRFLWA